MIDFTTSCREGSSRSCQTRIGAQIVLSIGSPQLLVADSVLAPEAALGSLPISAMSPAQVIHSFTYQPASCNIHDARIRGKRLPSNSFHTLPLV